MARHSRRKARLDRLADVGELLISEIESAEKHRESILSDFPPRVKAKQVADGERSVYELCSYENMVKTRSVNRESLRLLRRFQGMVNYIIGHGYVSLRKNDEFKEAHPRK